MRVVRIRLVEELRIFSSQLLQSYDKQTVYYRTCQMFR